MTPIEQWLEQRKIVNVEKYKEMVLLEKAMNQPKPDNIRLRKATNEDIVYGNIIWYKEGDNGPFWKIVEETLNPNDNWKAFIAEDGCRYGLYDAYVEI